MNSKRKAALETKDLPSKSPRCSRQPISKDYEDLCLKFPTIAESIFDELDNQSLVNCKEVSRTWCNFLEAPKFLLMRKIQKTVETRQIFRKVWRSVYQKLSTNAILQLEVATTKFFHNDENFTDYKSDNESESNCLTPIHVAAASGNTFLWQTLIEKVTNIEPKDEMGRTPLHYAAGEGQLGTCKLIIGKTVDKNPADNYGYTPLHYAATSGNLQCCQFILDQIKDKNPKAVNGVTPLHDAAANGHLHIYKDLIQYSEHMNPKNNDDVTPLHFAARYGYLKVCEYIIDLVEDKNPADNDGWTPLHSAAGNHNGAICELITSQLTEKNPEDVDGETPLKLWNEASEAEGKRFFE
jgi:ankyrin repeat protein